MKILFNVIFDVIYLTYFTYRLLTTYNFNYIWGYANKKKKVEIPVFSRFVFHGGVIKYTLL
jgi:hypothetical protein